MSNRDPSNFSSPHRLPTLSASQALLDLSSAPRKPISSALAGLDAILQGQESGSNAFTGAGGLSRGQVTEIYGPPGVGKTTFALQVSASALRSGSSVVWVAASYGLRGPRLIEIVTGFNARKHEGPPESSAENRSEDLLENFHHFTAPKLSHLIALLAHPSDSFPPEGTGLIVVDSISSLFAAAFPIANDGFDSKQISNKQKRDADQWATSRKLAFMGDFVSKLGKLATTKNIAILLTSQTATRIRADTGATLHPAISGTAWDAGLSARIVLFRDWFYQAAEASGNGAYMPEVRFAGVLKAGGVSYEGLGRVVSFIIKKDGLHGFEMNHINARANQSIVLPITASRKRKRDYIEDSQSEHEEVVGSDEEFGWDGDGHSLAAQNLIQ